MKGQVMQTKLTIRLEEALISKAKDYAKHSGKSLSQLVADYFMQLHTSTTAPVSTPLPPITAQLCGVLAPVNDSTQHTVSTTTNRDTINNDAINNDKQDYRDYLAEKYQ